MSTQQQKRRAYSIAAIVLTGAIDSGMINDACNGHYSPQEIEAIKQCIHKDIVQSLVVTLERYREDELRCVS